jgi:hypothetical protein
MELAKITEKRFVLKDGELVLWLKNF